VSHFLEIFSGIYPDDVLWIESVEGLAAASERMKAIATKAPGPYFVFDARTRKVLDSIDTTLAD